MNLENVKRIFIIAGPNGAGKTTFAREFLPDEAGCLHFVNADLIAAGLSPFAPEAAAFQAGRLMLRKLPITSLKGAALRWKPRFQVWVMRARFRNGAHLATRFPYIF